jgi:CheY-like chemotaxis protein
MKLTTDRKAIKEFSHIAVTANGFKEDEQNTLNTGCDSYLAKPLTKESLLDLIHEFILIIKYDCKN